MSRAWTMMIRGHAVGFVCVCVCMHACADSGIYSLARRPRRRCTFPSAAARRYDEQPPACHPSTARAAMRGLKACMRGCIESRAIVSRSLCGAAAPMRTVFAARVSLCRDRVSLRRCAPMCIVFATADGVCSLWVVSSPTAHHHHPQSGSVVPSRGAPPASRCSAMSSSIQPPAAAAATLPPWRCPQPPVPPPAAAAASADPSSTEVKKRAAAASPAPATKKQDTSKWKIAYGLIAAAILRRDMDEARALAVQWYVAPTTTKTAAAAASGASSASSEWL